jgi:hypothetical protein
MATFADAERTKLENCACLDTHGKVESVYVLYDRDLESYYLKVMFAPNTYKRTLADPVFINGVKVLFEERKAEDLPENLFVEEDNARPESQTKAIFNSK